MSKKAFDFLVKHKHLGVYVKKIGLLKLKKNNDLYFLLLRAIVGQQLSTKAADAIWSRFLLLFPNQYPEVVWLKSLDDEQLRSVGLSYAKAKYLKNIAEFSIQHTLDYTKLKPKTNEELIQYLTQIKGVGQWTVEMIMMFSLARPNVFSYGDLGLKQGIAIIFNLDIAAKDFKNKALQHIETFSPYKTYASMYLWRIKDNPINKRAQKSRDKLM